MKPIEFPEQNVVYAKDQPEYLNLPVHRDEVGTVTSCWELTPEEIETVKKTGKVYLRQMTFNQALQPVAMAVNIDHLIENTDGE